MDARLSTFPSGTVLEPTTQAKTRHRVLLVDDEVSVLRSLSRLLRGEAYELITTTNPLEAIDLLDQNPAQLIVTDQRMPEMSGTDLLAVIRRRWPDTIRIILSGYSEVNAILNAVNQGAVYQFLTKPWNDEEIKLHFRRALDQHDLMAENRQLFVELEERNAHITQLNDQLKQYFEDASRGLACCHDVLETMDVGIVTIDDEHMVVGANRRAISMLKHRAIGMIGASADAVLPDEVLTALVECTLAGHHGGVKRLSTGGCTYQWRSRPMSEPMLRRGIVIAFWEEQT